jgi:Tfp pilus assembly protein PilO
LKCVQEACGVVNLSLEESDRQLVLMALAHLAVERPGWDYALREIAARIDNGSQENPTLYGQFKQLRFGAVSA